jgi:hypothetical protein
MHEDGATCVDGSEMGQRSKSGASIFDLGKIREYLQRYAFSGCLAAIAIVVVINSSNKVVEKVNTAQFEPETRMTILPSSCRLLTSIPDCSC